MRSGSAPYRSRIRNRSPIVDFVKDSFRSGWWSTRSANFTSKQWDSLQRHQQAFSEMVAWSAKQFNLVQEGQARYAEGLFVSGDFFNVLGVPPAAGRVFNAQDDQPGCGSSGAVLGYSFWQGEFGGDPNITGKTIRLDGQVFPIIGVAAPGFFGVEIGHRFDVAVPLCSDPLFWEPGKDGKGRIPIATAWWLSIMGRLKPGLTISQANAQLKAISPQVMTDSLPATYRADNAKKYQANKLLVTSGATGVSQLRRQYEDPLWISARDNGPGAADRLRQSGESAAGARQRAGTRNRGPAGARRFAWTPHPAACFRKACCWRCSVRLWGRRSPQFSAADSLRS